MDKEGTMDKEDYSGYRQDKSCINEMVQFLNKSIASTM